MKPDDPSPPSHDPDTVEGSGRTISFRPSGPGPDPESPARPWDDGPPEVRSYVSTVLRLGLASGADLGRLLGGPKPLPRDPQAMAQELVRTGLPTRYQAGAVLRGKTKGLVLGRFPARWAASLVVASAAGLAGLAMLPRSSRVEPVENRREPGLPPLPVAEAPAPRPEPPPPIAGPPPRPAPPAPPEAFGEVGWLVGHDHDRVEGVAVSPDGRLAFSGGFDGKFRLWDLKQARERTRYTTERRPTAELSRFPMADTH